MKIRIIAILSADGYLLPADVLQARRLPQKYRPDAFREQADLSLHRDSSLLSLLAERRDSSDTVYSVVSTVAMVIAWGYGLWKNHNFTAAACEAQGVLDQLKGKTQDNIVVEAGEGDE